MFADENRSRCHSTWLRSNLTILTIVGHLFKTQTILKHLNLFRTIPPQIRWHILHILNNNKFITCMTCNQFDGRLTLRAQLLSVTKIKSTENLLSILEKTKFNPSLNIDFSWNSENSLHFSPFLCRKAVTPNINFYWSARKYLLYPSFF